MKTTQTINLENMSCGHCVKAVQNALNDIENLDVNSVELGKAEISFNPAEVSIESISAILAEEGYPVAK